MQSVAVVHKGGVFWGLQYHPEYDLHELARLCYCRKQKLTDKGFFRDMEAAQAFVDQLGGPAPGSGPQGPRLAARHRRGCHEPRHSSQAEVRNWIEQLVLPSMGR